MSGTSVTGIAAVAVLAVAVTGAGLVAFWPAADASTAGPPVGHNASEQFAALDGYAATVETVIHSPSGTDRIVRRIRAKPGTDKRRVEALGNGTASLVVSNGSVTWIYDRAANNVTKLRVPDYGDGTRQGALIERLFTRLNVSRDARNQTTTAAITPGSAPLPSVPRSRPAVTPTPNVAAADSVGVRYNGTTTVAGRTVYVLTIDPQSGGDATAVLEEYRRTIYVDAEWFLPLKTHTEWTGDSGHVELTQTYLNVTFNPGLDADLFTFDPPANATVVRPDLPDARTYDSAAALRRAVSLPVPDPAVPASFDLDTARAVFGNFSSASLRYSNETTALGVSVTNGTAYGGSDGERLTVDGRTVRYRRIGPTRTVSWQCEGHVYSVSGTAVSKDTLLDVTASIECS